MSCFLVWLLLSFSKSKSLSRRLWGTSERGVAAESSRIFSAWRNELIPFYWLDVYGCSANGFMFSFLTLLSVSEFIYYLGCFIMPYSSPVSIKASFEAFKAAVLLAGFWCCDCKLATLVLIAIGATLPTLLRRVLSTALIRSFLRLLRRRLVWFASIAAWCWCLCDVSPPSWSVVLPSNDPLNGYFWPAVVLDIIIAPPPVPLLIFSLESPLAEDKRTGPPVFLCELRGFWRYWCYCKLVRVSVSRLRYRPSLLPRDKYPDLLCMLE